MERKNALVSSAGPKEEEDTEEKALASYLTPKKLDDIKNQIRTKGVVICKVDLYTFTIFKGSNDQLYAIGYDIGEGSFGVIYKTWQLVAAETPVPPTPKVLKTLHNIKEGDRNNIEQELTALQALSDPSATLLSKYDRIHDALCMRYIDGDMLIHVVTDEKKREVRKVHDKIKDLPPVNRIDIVIAILKNLQTIHEQRWVHCDIKGGNILFKLDPKTNQVTVNFVDFGSARKLDEGKDSTMDKNAHGTPSHLSPERKLGLITTSTDIFAIAHDISLILGDDISQLPHIPEPMRKSISTIKNNFIAKMQSTEIESRPTADQALEFFHDFRQVCIACQKQSPTFFSRPQEGIKGFEILANTFLQAYSDLLKPPEKPAQKLTK